MNDVLMNINNYSKRNYSISTVSLYKAVLGKEKKQNSPISHPLIRPPPSLAPIHPSASRALSLRPGLYASKDTDLQLPRLIRVGSVLAMSRLPGLLRRAIKPISGPVDRVSATEAVDSVRFPVC